VVGTTFPGRSASRLLDWRAANVWEYAGALTLKAAGLETVETAEAKNTWFEILGQSLAVVARSIGSLLHREVTTENGGERAVDGA
jgi:hypothetical protein